MTDTAAQPAAAHAPRTYGNWRKPVSPGLPRLGMLGTAAALGALVLVMLVQITAGLLAAACCLLLVCAGLAPLAWRNRADRNGWQVLTAKLCWWLGRRRRQHLYASSLTGPVSFGAARLPGLLASSRLLSAITAHGEHFALIHLPATRHYAVVIRIDPQGAQLVDVETVDEWVACWGGWLAKLGHEANLEACSVTVETAPDPGSRLAAEVDAMLTDDAPALSRAVLTEAAADYPHGSAAVTAYVTLTFSARRLAHTEAEGVLGTGGGSTGSPTRRATSVRTEQEMAAQIGRRLPLLLHQLRNVGAGTGAAMTAAELAETVRVAYDPAAGPLLDRARAQQAHELAPGRSVRAAGHLVRRRTGRAGRVVGPPAPRQRREHHLADGRRAARGGAVPPPRAAARGRRAPGPQARHDHLPAARPGQRRPDRRRRRPHRGRSGQPAQGREQGR